MGNKTTQTSMSAALLVEAARLIHQKKHQSLLEKNSILLFHQLSGRRILVMGMTWEKRKLIIKALNQDKLGRGRSSWMVCTFVDMMTLLFAFFVLLAAISTMIL